MSVPVISERFIFVRKLIDTRNTRIDAELHGFFSLCSMLASGYNCAGKYFL